MHRLMHFHVCVAVWQALVAVQHLGWASDNAFVKQIPFDEVVAGRGSSSSQPHTLVPANLLLTTVQSLAPSTSQPPRSTQHHVTGTHSPHSSSGRALYCTPTIAPVSAEHAICI